MNRAYGARPIAILHLEDESSEAELVREMLSGVPPGFEIARARRLADAIALARNRRFDVALLDLCVDDSTGITTFEEFHAQVPSLPVIVMTNIADEGQAGRAVHDGAQDYLVKRSVDGPLLVRSIRYAIERQGYEEALRRSEERYALAVRGSNDGVWDWDLSRGALYLSARWKAILGFSEDELESSREAWLSRVHPDDRAGLDEALEGHLSGRLENFEHEYRLRHKSGDYVWVLSRGLAVRAANGEVLRMAGSLTDIRARKAAEERLLRDALHDALTGLPNRNLFRDRLAFALKGLRRRPGQQLAVMFLDIDRFKNINDSLGHRAGDDLLVQFARRVAAVLRPGDTVARLGGDEFAIIALGVRSTQQARQIGDRLLELSREPYQIGSREVFLAASIGITMGTFQGQSPDDILRDADIAMYQAKARGKNRVELFDALMHSRAMHVMELETALRRAVDRGELAMHYQPIVSLTGGRIVGLEALVRWRHPERGLVRPDEFIPFAEEIGLIVPIGWWTIREVCRHTRVLQQELGGDAMPLTVSVNVSGKLFAQPDFVAGVARIVEEESLDGTALCIEVTESVLLENAGDAKSKIDALRRLGIGLHMDDFGTGYSSLSHLQKFDYDSMKIDRSFIQELGHSDDAAAIVNTIIALGRVLGVNVIAEGVETAAQVRRLKQLQCPEVQGFWFSPPVSVAEVATLLRDTPSWPLDGPALSSVDDPGPSLERRELSSAG